MALVVRDAAVRSMPAPLLALSLAAPLALSLALPLALPLGVPDPAGAVCTGEEAAANAASVCVLQ
jgi:hypothetical protein